MFSDPPLATICANHVVTELTAAHSPVSPHSRVPQSPEREGRPAIASGGNPRAPVVLRMRPTDQEQEMTSRFAISAAAAMLLLGTAGAALAQHAARGGTGAGSARASGSSGGQ